MNQNMFTLLTKIMPDNKILAIYKVGSSIFGLSDDESDKDYIVIVDGFDGTNVIKEENCDFFVIGDSSRRKSGSDDRRFPSFDEIENRVQMSVCTLLFLHFLTILPLHFLRGFLVCRHPDPYRTIHNTQEAASQ